MTIVLSGALEVIFAFILVLVGITEQMLMYNVQLVDSIVYFTASVCLMAHGALRIIGYAFYYQLDEITRDEFDNAQFTIWA